MLIYIYTYILPGRDATFCSPKLIGFTYISNTFIIDGCAKNARIPNGISHRNHCLHCVRHIDVLPKRTKNRSKIWSVFFFSFLFFHCSPLWFSFVLNASRAQRYYAAPRGPPQGTQGTPRRGPLDPWGPRGPRDPMNE